MAPDPATPTAPGPPERPPLVRRADDRVIGGVCAAIARHLGIDPTLARVGAVVLALTGAGLLGYLAAYLLIPSDGASGVSRGSTVAGVVVLVIAVLALVPGAGFLVPLSGTVLLLGLGAAALWWIASSSGDGAGRRVALVLALLVGCALLAAGAFTVSALGGRTAVAVAVIVTGLVIVGSALAHRPVRAAAPVALSVALPLALVTATDLDLRGGFGDETYRVASLSMLEDRYRVGAGELTLDLRDVEFDGATRRVELSVGAGEARVLVPEDVCISGRVRVQGGVAQVLGRSREGWEVDWTEQRTARPGSGTLVLDAEVGFGELLVTTREHLLDDELDRGPFRGADRILEADAAGCTE